MSEDLDWGDDEGDDDDGGWGDDAGDAGGGWGEDEGDDPFEEPLQQQETGFGTDLKNNCWTAADENDPVVALELYDKAIQMGEENFSKLDGELHGFVFNAMKDSTIILNQQGKEEDMLKRYTKTMDYFVNVTPDEIEKAIKKILTSLDQDEKASDVREKIFAQAVGKLETMPDLKHVLLRFQMSQAGEFVQQGQVNKARTLLEQLHSRCRNPDGTDNQDKGSELIDIYALRMRMAGDQADVEVTKELYAKTKNLNAKVKNPKSQSIIRECWGKMWGDDDNWQKAYQDFYLAFTGYQEANMHTNAKQCLTYVIVANMLSSGNANPFDAPEAKALQQDKEMEPVINIRKAKEKKDVNAFAIALSAFDRTWPDPWIKRHMQTMIADFHKTCILQFVKSYRTLKISFLADALQIPAEKCEWYLIQMILDGDVFGEIDQVEGILDLSQSGGGGKKKYHAMQVWAGTIGSVNQHLPQLRTPHNGGGMLKLTPYF